MSYSDSVSYEDTPGQEFGNVLKEVLKKKRFYQKSKYGALSKAWKEVVGDEVASETKIVAYKHGRLRVEVNSSVLFQELSGFMKDSILEELQEMSGGQDVSDIRFCLGSESGE